MKDAILILDIDKSSDARNILAQFLKPFCCLIDNECLDPVIYP